jgi:hypothetical protein
MANSYRAALVYGLLMGVGIYVGIAAGKHATVVSAIPYGLVSALGGVAAASAFVAYRNGQPPRR